LGPPGSDRALHPLDAGVLASGVIFAARDRQPAKKDLGIR